MPMTSGAPVNAGPTRRSGPAKIVALGPARPCGLCSCGCGVPRIGPPALSPASSSPSRARALHRAAGRLTVSGKASVLCCWPRRSGAVRAPRFQREFCLADGAMAGRRGYGVLRLTPNAQRVRGQNRNLSLISVAERNQHRHSMTPGRLAAVKDRGCPPILACGGEAPCEQKSAPPAPALRGGSARAAVPDCLTPASLRWASFISVMRDNSFWRLS
jgi:hypothetical protein